MLFNRYTVSVAILGVLIIAAVQAVKAYEVDPYMSLEDIDSPQSLAWVNERNEKSLKLLRSDPRFASTESSLRSIVLAKDRIPMPAQLDGGFVYNFWQDATHVRGLWRRVKVEQYSGDKIQWETVIDLDRLAKDESENWVYKGASCHDGRCLISLSRGGGDAVVIREFDLGTKTFVTNGFVLSEAKSDASWIDRDTLLVGTDFGAGSLTTSGYPRITKVWKRGTSLASAHTVYEGLKSDVAISPYVVRRPEGTHVMVSRSMTFYTHQVFEVSNWSSNAPTTAMLQIPEDATSLGVFKGQAIVSLRSPWKVGGTEYGTGSVISVPLQSDKPDQAPNRAEVLFVPTERSSFETLTMSSDAVYLQVLDNVRGHMIRADLNEAGNWTRTPVELPDFGSVQLLSSDSHHPGVLVSYESFLTPVSVYSLDMATGAAAHRSLPKVVQQSKARFDASGFEVQQNEAVSKDGTRIPYFLVSKKNLVKDGSNPTLLYGYGGFEISMTPSYLSATGKVWLEKGGVYALANIRGGGEFGPAWHKAALLENRQKAFDDFIAVAEDLSARKITSPRRLGIQGGSNGGLLVGAVMTQRPELFNAVICQVPLLDMLRYHLLLAGASWMAEYGDPADPRMEPILRGYSPYHNVVADKKYPTPFFMTSTRDDRVHPGHARKMVARMEEQGHPVLMYENTEGGHGGSANLEQVILQGALRYTYLYQRLM